MPAETIAILMPGDMGHGVGRALREHGKDVITALDGRSDRTRGLAETAGLRDVGSLENAMSEAGLVLSILPPASAIAQAQDAAEAMAKTGAKPVYVDCNAIAPQTARAFAGIFRNVGAPFVDCGIIGLAPGKSGGTRFYISGEETGPVLALNGLGFDVISVGKEPGRASALKMTYAGLTKGTLDDVVVVPFNDPEALDRALATGDVAAFIVEPVMENIGICLDPDVVLANPARLYLNTVSIHAQL